MGGVCLIHGDLVPDVNSFVWRRPSQLLLPGPHQSLGGGTVAVGKLYDRVEV